MFQRTKEFYGLKFSLACTLHVWNPRSIIGVGRFRILGGGGGGGGQGLEFWGGQGGAKFPAGT